RMTSAGETPYLRLGAPGVSRALISRKFSRDPYRRLQRRSFSLAPLCQSTRTCNNARVHQ
ncbi:MAG: hypothetical protein ACRDHE_09965, partial [Ktedonobacterales bacterium]